MNKRLTRLRPVAFRTGGDDRAVLDSVWYPAPGVYNSTMIGNAEFAIYLNTDGAEVAVGAQYSDNGVDWLTGTANLGILAKYNGGGSAWVSSSGARTDVGVVATLPGGFEARNNSGPGTDLPNNKLFVRFGLWVRNQSGVTKTRGGTFMLDVTPRTGDHGTVAGGPTLCMSGGKPSGTKVAIETPLTPAIPTEGVVLFRPTVDIHANTGVEMILVQFESADGGVTWSTGVPLEGTSSGPPVTPTVYDAVGTYYPDAAFVALHTPLTKPLVRFGVRVTNAGSSTDYLSALVGLRIDWRAD